MWPKQQRHGCRFGLRGRSSPALSDLDRTPPLLARCVLFVHDTVWTGLAYVVYSFVTPARACDLGGLASDQMIGVFFVPSNHVILLRFIVSNSRSCLIRSSHPACCCLVLKAAKAGSLSYVKALLLQGQDPNQTDYSGQYTPLIAAAFLAHIQVQQCSGCGLHSVER